MSLKGAAYLAAANFLVHDNYIFLKKYIEIFGIDMS